MEEKLRLTCSVCQTAIRVRAATKARFAICPKCQARTPIPERESVPVEISSPIPEAEEPTTEPAPAPAPAKEFTQADLAPATENTPMAGAPPVDAQSDTPQAQPAVEAPPEGGSQDLTPAPAPAPEEAPAPVKGALPKKPGTRPLPGKRSTLGTKRGLPGKDDAGAPKKGGSKMIWVVVFVVVLLGGGAGLYFSGMLDSMMGKGGGGAASQKNPVDEIFAAAKSRDVDAVMKFIKGASPKLKEDMKKLYGDLDQYEPHYTIKSAAGSKYSVEWNVTYKVKASSDPGGETNPKPKDSPLSTDDFIFEQDGAKWVITLENLPIGFPVPKH